MDDEKMTEDPRAATARANGMKAGQPPGSENADKRTYPADDLIDSTADAIMTGKRSPLTLSNVGPMTPADAHMLGRVTKMPAE